MRIALAIFCCFFSLSVAAKEVTIQWSMPANNCDGQPQPMADEIQIYIATAPIPANADPCESVADEIPTGPTVVETITSLDATTGQVVVNLLGGQTYYVRARLRVGTRWSNLSAQAVRELELDPLSPPVVIILGGG